MIRLLLNPETGRRRAFIASALIGMASLFCVQILWFVPVVWFVMMVNLQVMSLRVLLASVLGVVMPYWIVAPYIIHKRLFDLASHHFDALFALLPVANFDVLTTQQLAAVAVTVLATTLAMVYYYRHNHPDRLRVRLSFHGYAILFFFSLAVFLLQPELFWLCLAFMALGGMPFISRTFVWIF